MIEIWDSGKHLYKEIDPFTGLAYSNKSGEALLVLLDTNSMFAVAAKEDVFWGLVDSERDVLEAWFTTQNRYLTTLNVDNRNLKGVFDMERLTDTDIDSYYRQGARYNPLTNQVEYNDRVLKITAGSVFRFRAHQWNQDNAKANKLKAERPKLYLIKGGNAQ